MKINTLLSVITSCIIYLGLTSCGESVKQEGLTYYNDFESYQGWNNYPLQLHKGTANSGLFSNKTDTNASYSYAFAIGLGEVHNKPLSKVTASAMTFRNTPGAKADLVIEILDQDGKSIAWASTRIDDSLIANQTWGTAKCTLSLTTNKLNLPSNRIKVFVWNQGKTPIYVDDFEITFSEL